MFHDTELADTVAGMDDGIPHSDGREVLLVVVAAVAFVHHTHMIGLDDAKILEGRATRDDVGFIALGELHSDAQRNQPELTLPQPHILSGP